MNDKKIKKHKSWYKIFLILGSYGLLDVVVGTLMKQSDFGFENGHGLTFIIIYVLSYLFGTKIATSVFLFVMAISFAWPAWFCVSEILRQKIIKLEKADQ